MRQIVDKHSARFVEVDSSSKRPGVLATIRGAVTGWKANRNGRTYSRDLWEKALNSDYVKEQVALRHFVGEADHPEERLEPIIKEMSHSITDFEFHDETSEVWATIDILDTPNGHLLKTLLDYSGSLSFSTRGSGDVMENGEVDPDTYQLFAIDAVLRPSYPTATVGLTESVDFGKITNDQAKKLIEKYSGSKLEESWTEVDSKYIEDSDGFTTEYTMYVNEDGVYRFVFGDKDLYKPEEDWDWEEENEEAAKEWFDNYKGFEEHRNYIESSLFKLNHPKAVKLKENYGDTKDYSESIEKLYSRWWKENADLGIRFFNLMSDFNIDVEEQGKGPERCMIYTMVVYAPFVDAQDWKEEIGQYIADHIPSIELVKTYEIEDKNSDDYENIVWIFKQQIGMPDFGADL